MSSSCTSRIGKLALLAVCGVSFLGFSQTADQLKTRFATLLGANKYAKLVWQEESCDGRKPNFDYSAPGGSWCGTATKIMTMDTKDGIVRQLAGRKTGTHYSSATFTWDGSTVVFTDNAQWQVTIVDWADTTKKKVMRNYEGNGYCYQTPDGKNWALITQYLGNSTVGAKLRRVNVADTSEKVDIYTCPHARVEWGGTYGAGATCWASISSNGKYVAGGFPNYGGLKILTVAAGNMLNFATNGCWPTMARDTTGDILYTIDSHTDARLMTRGNVVKSTTSLVSAIGSGNQFDCMRWTPDRDYATVWVYGSGFASAGKPNPRLVRLSDRQYAAVVDNPTTAVGNMDVYFYTPSASASPVRPVSLNFDQRMSARASLHDLAGRVVVRSRTLSPGVYFRIDTRGVSETTVFANLER